MKISRSSFLFVFTGAIIVCFVAFLNRFPIVYPDTASYIVSGFSNKVPWDRPIFYGLFIRHISLATSPWFVILAQGLLVSYMVYKTFDMFYSGDKRNLIFIFSLVLLTVASSVSYNSSILLPDIFTGLCILCFVNVLLNDKLDKVNRIVVYIIFIYSMLVHFSNFLSLFLLTFLILIYVLVKRVRKQSILLRRSRIISVCISVWSILLIAPSVNYAFSKHFTFSDGSHVFILNHLREIGVLQDYLNNECAHKNYKLCQYRDQLTGDFVWGNDSPFYKMGGHDSTKEEFDKIIVDILTTPKYLKDVAVHSIELSLVQFFSFDMPSNGVNSPTILVDEYNQYNGAYRASLQSNDKLDSGLHTLTQLQRILVLFSMGIFICVLFIPNLFKLLSSQLKWLIVMILISCYINAAVCANFSGIDNRYQDRVIWLIPLTVIIILEHFISAYIQKLRKNKSINLL